MRSIKCRKAFLLSTAVVVGILGGSANGAVAQSEPTYQLDIPAESLSRALKDFSVASSQQLVFSERDVGNRSVPALHGSYTRDQALAILLSGTDLHVETSPSGVLMVRPKKERAALNEGGATEISPETVVVTGTRIQDASPTSPVTTVTRQDILDSGYSNTGDVIRSLSQNFSGGINPGVVAAPGTDNQLNVSGASSFDLRGLGPSSTLTLIDGHRFAADGLGGAVDVSMIPVSAIQRIEVVTDGASAIYGSDAIAGVANFILRKTLTARKQVSATAEQPKVVMKNRFMIRR